jgi:hypothetical protein
MHRLSLLLLACLVTVFSFGQSHKSYVNPHFVESAQSSAPVHPVNKLGMLMNKKLQQPEFAQSNELKNMMVKGDPAAIRTLTEQYKGNYKYAAGKISSIAIPYKNIIAFSQSKAVEQIETYGDIGTGHSFMDTARIQNNIDSAHIGYAPLTQAYTGAGVLAGIIDGGIYFRHQDFKRSNGNTRIRYIWDQTTGGNGTVWDSAQINNGTCTHIEPSSDQGHGTAAAGILAGNGSSWATGDAYLRGRYTGVAPESDMVVVRVNNNSQDYLATIADAIHFIFDKADSLHMPCVINTSVGTYYGPHDGSELAVQAIDAMLDAKPGRVLVAAAGNGGSIKHHLRYQLSATDSLWTWFLPNCPNPNFKVYFDLWADTAQFKNANFALGCDLSSNGAYRGRTRYFNVPVDFLPHLPPGGYYQIVDTLFGAGHVALGAYGIGVTSYQGLYHVEFFASPIPSNSTDLWRLETKGQGTFDAWASRSLMGTSDFATLGNPSLWPNYRFPDTIKTIVSAWQCSDKVITVANYNNRAGYFDIDSNYVSLPAQVGALAASSSIGPTRDGRSKPDIGATGDVVTTTGDSTYVSQLTLSGGANRRKISLGGKHVRDGGTSMASPIVAGCACLYLQEHPNATYAEVKTVLERTAKLDNFTSASAPNTRFGYGKLNCYEALKYQVVYGCQDTGAVNYVANSNMDTGGCIPKVYGCNDTGSINYNSLANVNNGSCVAKVYGCTDTGSINYSAQANVSNGACIPKVYGIMDTLCRNYNAAANVNSGVCQGVGIHEINSGDLTLDVTPNPFSKTTTISVYSSITLPNAEIRFYDVLGKSADAVKLPSGTKQIVYNNAKLAAGVYEVTVVSNNSIIAVKKVVVE